MCFFFEIIKGKIFRKWTFINVQFYNKQPFIENIFEKVLFFTFISISIIKLLLKALKTPYHKIFLIKKKDLGVFLLYKYTTNDNRKSAKKRNFFCV